MIYDIILKYASNLEAWSCRNTIIYLYIIENNYVFIYIYIYIYKYIYIYIYIYL